MILTYKIRHERDFSRELSLARKVAEFALTTKSWSSAQVKHIGLKSMIACQILKKYSHSKTIKSVKSVKLTIPSQGIKVISNEIHIPCVKLTLPIYFDKNFEKINQVEIGSEFAYVSVSYREPPTTIPEQTIGVDRNTTHHIVVASNINTGKVLKLGKECLHIHTKYKQMRRRFQHQSKLTLVKQIKHRESNIIRNLNHHISKALVQEARDSKAVLVLEDLKEIRQTARTRRTQRYSLHSWSFYQLSSMIEYKSKKLGVSVAYVEPAYTSQRCSKCGHIDAKNRNGNTFHCVKCNAVEDSGANAGFNIAYLHQQRIPRFAIDRDMAEGSTDTPREATL